MNTSKIAFAHDEAKTDINPSVGDYKSRMMNSVPKVIALVLIILGIIYLISSTAKKALQNEAARTKSVTQAPQEVSALHGEASGTFTLNTNTWQGVTRLEGGYEIGGKMLTPGVRWQVRLDKDDNRIYDLLPTDWAKSTTNVTTTPFNIREWRIKPGEAITNATFAWYAKKVR